MLPAGQVRQKKKRLRGLGIGRGSRSIGPGFGKSLRQPGADCFVQIFFNTLIDFGSETGTGGHGSQPGRRQQRSHLALVLFQLLPDGVGAIAGFFTPLRVRVHAQVMIPVIERLMVEELMFRDDGAIEERDGIVGVQLQGLA